MMNAQNQKQLDTDELMRFLQSAPELETALENSAILGTLDFSKHLDSLLTAHSITAARVIQQAILSKSFGYQIFNGTRHPSRDILLRIAVVMKLTVEETQRLLTVARHGRLYPKIRRDAAIIFSIQNKYTLEQSCELLDSIGELPLL